MIISITGGKGGTGKSTIATALAFGLSKKQKTLLVDADVDCPNDHLILAINRKKKRSIKKMIPNWDFSKCIKCGKCSKACRTNAILSIKKEYPIFIPEQCNSCGACILTCPVNAIKRSKKEIGTIFTGKIKNLSFVSGEMIPGEPISEFGVNAVMKYVKSLKSKYKFIIIDTAVGTHCNVISALLDSDIVFIIAEPTPLGAHDMELMLKLASILNIPVKIIINKSDIGEKRILKKIAKKYNVDILLEIPYDKKILIATSKGKPFVNKKINRLVNILIKNEKSSNPFR